MKNNITYLRNYTGEELEKAANHLRGTLDALPDHQCAYCGSFSTTISKMEISSDRIVWFDIKCSHCKKTDAPAMREDHLKAILKLY
jgi:hypothetical protein